MSEYDVDAVHGLLGGHLIIVQAPGQVFEPWGSNTPRARRLALGLVSPITAIP
jgi:hypothetical protein